MDDLKKQDVKTLCAEKISYTRVVIYTVHRRDVILKSLCGHVETGYILVKF